MTNLKILSERPFHHISKTVLKTPELKCNHWLLSHKPGTIINCNVFQLSIISEKSNVSIIIRHRLFSWNICLPPIKPLCKVFRNLTISKPKSTLETLRDSMGNFEPENNFHSRILKNKMVILFQTSPSCKYKNNLFWPMLYSIWLCWGWGVWLLYKLGICVNYASFWWLVI